uniref:Phospholipase/carboxylesterase/thioesterase domain-containing protein n=1 Tax=Phaeomonas parva TaxID=124430 RepID=A0A7S1XZ76_9STRA|mmetsp:Transcript_5020/g.14225  ORF Transcript_5020/g.14225 Transcript_5020/m.14225 type:complete len:265 (+) Transcript_5020:61-855(+)
MPRSGVLAAALVLAGGAATALGLSAAGSPGGDMAATLRLGSRAARGPPSASVILIHGLGDSAEGLRGLVPYLANAVPHATFILPTAPIRPITMNGGYEMTGWYDIEGLSERANENADGLEDSIAAINGLIDEEMARGVPPSRIVVSGFSQGGAMSLWTGLTRAASADPLAAVVCMSGYIPAASQFRLTETGRRTPTRMFHGDVDPVVLMDFAVSSEALLREQGHPDLAMKTYAGLPHSINEDELGDVASFLASVLPPAGDAAEL